MKAAPSGPPAWLRQSAVAVLAVVALYNALIQFGISDRFASRLADPYNVMEMLSRVRPVLERVPLAERVGFFSDVPFDLPAGQAALFAAQYAFAPRILVRENSPAAAKARYWLGVFSQQVNFAQAGAQRGLVLEQDLGGYVILYRREGPAQ